MASTNKTTNYELSQFEGTDKPSWEADYNADMLSIDTNLKAVSDVADGASGSISTLADRVTTAEGNITTNANDIDALEARADALEAGQTSDDSRLDALEAEQLIQNTAIEGNTQLGYNLARPYDSASTYAVGAYVLFQNTLYKCTTAVSTGEAFDPNKWLAIKATDEISAGGYTLPTASASTLGGVKVGSNLSIDQDGVLSGSAPYTLPIASANDLGGVKVGNNLSIDANGVLSATGGVTIDNYITKFAESQVLNYITLDSAVNNTTSTDLTSSTTLSDLTYFKIGDYKYLKIAGYIRNYQTANAQETLALTLNIVSTIEKATNDTISNCVASSAGSRTGYCYSGNAHLDSQITGNKFKININVNSAGSISSGLFEFSASFFYH